MSKTALEQSLQLLLQDSTAAAVVAVLLTAGLVGMSIRTIIESVVTDETEVGEPIGDGGTTGLAAASASSDAEDQSGTVSETKRRQRTEKREAEPESDEELEHRLDELEDEVDTLSSTVKTVRHENEQISSSVQDIEENTGRLLNLYRMATRGVNPFAGEGDPANTSAVTSPQEAGDESESFSKEDEIEEIETDVADSDAADLFGSGETETAIREEHCVDSVEEVVDSGSETEDAFQQAKGSEQTAEEPPTEEEEIDDEFEPVFEIDETDVESDTPDEQFGTEEMIGASGEEPTPESSESSQESAPEAGGRSNPAASDGGQLLEPGAAADTVGEGADSIEEPAESAPAVESSEQETGMSAPVGGGTASSDLAGGKPYIESVPEGITTEVMTVEWLEYLVDEVGIRGTVRALDYYQTIGWLTDDAVAELDTYLDAFEESETEDLSIEHHLRSLDYVEELKHAGAEK